MIRIMNKKSRISIAALLLLVGFSFSINANELSNRLIVKLKPSSNQISTAQNLLVDDNQTSKASELVKNKNLAIDGERELLGADIRLVTLSRYHSVSELEKVANEIQLESADVEFVEVDVLLKPNAIFPNDPSYVYQWHLGSIDGINMPQAWEYTQGSDSVVVAVLDTGVLLNHGDFESDRFLAGYDFISSEFVANDGDGRDANPADPGDGVTIDDLNAAGISVEECNPKKSSWHGTHVTGTIAATANNGFGIAGIDWQAQILPVRVLGRCGGWTSDIAEAIEWAAGASTPEGVPVNLNPASVINLSLGARASCESDSIMQVAIDKAVGAGATVVVSAGNSNDDTLSYRPANCNNVIVVGAHDINGNKASYSNYGEEVDIMAPGGGARNSTDYVWSLSDLGEYNPLYDDSILGYVGTSMAAPHVSAVASLMLSRNEDLSPEEIEGFIKQAAILYQPGTTCELESKKCGAGRLDAASAINFSAVPYAPSNLAIDIINSKISLSWADNALLESGYAIERTDESGSLKQVILGQNTVQYLDDTVEENTRYTYTVSAINGEYSSSSLSGVTNGTKINAPRDFLVNFVVNQGVLVTWNDNSSVENRYVLERAVQKSDNYQGVASLPANTVQYIDNYLNLLEGETYYYRIGAETAQGDLSDKSEIGIKIPFNAPNAFSVDFNQDGLVQLTWQDSSWSEDGFYVYRSTNGTSFTLLKRLPKNSVEFVDTTADEGQTYFYKMVAYRSGQQSNFTSVQEISVNTFPPNNLKLETTPSKQIVITFTNPSQRDDIHFELLKATNSDAYTLLETVSLSDLSSSQYSYFDSDVTEGNAYRYKINVISPQGSVESEPKQIMLVANPVGDLVVSSESYKNIQLEWENLSQLADGFNVYRSFDGNNFSLIKEIDNSDVSVFDDRADDPDTETEEGTLLSGRTYYYKVVPKLGGQLGVESTVVKGSSALEAPIGLQTIANSDNTISISWVDISDYETRYVLYRSVDGGGYQLLKSLPKVELDDKGERIGGYVDNKGLLENTTYTYRLTASNNYHSSKYSEVSSATTNIFLPQVIEVELDSSNQLTVSFVDQSLIEDKYDLYRSVNEGPFVIAESFSGLPDSGTLIEWVDPEIEEGNRYQYRVEAVKDDLVGRLTSEIVNVVGFSPKNLSIIDQDFGYISLKWENTSSIAAEYLVQRSINNITFETLGSVNGAAYKDESVTGNNTYYYRIVPVVDGALGVPSEVARGKAQLKAPEFTSIVDTPSGVELAWVDNSGFEQAYVVERNLNNSYFIPIKTLAPGTQFFKDSTAKDGVHYRYRVAAKNQYHYSYTSSDLSVERDLNAPAGLKSDLVYAGLSEEDYLVPKLTWLDQSDSDVGYILERSSGQDFSNIDVRFNVVGTTTYVDTTAEENGSYYYRVKTYNERKESSFGSSIWVDTQFVPPVGVSVERTEENYLRVVWDDTYTSEAGYIVERMKEGDDTFARVAALAPNTSEYLDERVIDGTLYHYRLKVRVLAYTSEPSEVVNDTTNILEPNNVMVSLVNKSLLVEWDDESSSEDEYLIYRSVADAPYEFLGKLESGVTAFKDLDVQDGFASKYKVASRNKYAISQFIETDSIQVQLFGASNLSAQATDFEINLSWVDESNSETGYSIERSSDGVNFEVIDDLPSGAESYRDAGLNPNTAYYYRVQAYNETARSLYSTVIQITTKSEIGAFGIQYVLVLLGLVGIRRKQRAS